MELRKSNWSNNYSDLVCRNIGILTLDEQEKLKNSNIVVFGVGGLGEIAVSNLVRMGVGNITIVDFDKFESSNRNRQIFSFVNNIFKSKIKVTKNFLKKINPEVKIKVYKKVNQENISQIFKNIDIGILALDSFVELLIIAREARRQNISLVESWALPYLNVRVIDPQKTKYEKLYDIDENIDLENITKEEVKKYNLALLQKLIIIPGLLNNFTKDSIEEMAEGRISVRSLSPFAQMNGIILALEAVKVLLGKGKIANLDKFELYDLMNYEKVNY